MPDFNRVSTRWTKGVVDASGSGVHWWLSLHVGGMCVLWLWIDVWARWWLRLCLWIKVGLGWDLGTVSFRDGREGKGHGLSMMGQQDGWAILVSGLEAVGWASCCPKGGPTWWLSSKSPEGRKDKGMIRGHDFSWLEECVWEINLEHEKSFSRKQ